MYLTKFIFVSASVVFEKILKANLPVTKKTVEDQQEKRAGCSKQMIPLVDLSTRRGSQDHPSDTEIQPLLIVTV